MIADTQPVGTSVGVAALLRETRVKLGRDIAVAATTLRIRQPYLQAIEDGRFHDLPGATYAVGFVRGYAEYLGLDGSEIVRRFKQENSDLSGRAELVFPSATSGGGIPTGALLGFAVIGAVIAYGVWYWMQDRGDQMAEAVPPLPERLAALIHKPVGDGNDTVPVQENTQVPSSSPTPTPETASMPQPPISETAPQPAAEEAPPPASEPVVAPEPAKPDAKASKLAAAKAAKIETPPPAAMTAAGDNPTAVAEAPPAPKPEPKPVWHASKRVQIRALDDCWIKIRDANGQMVLSRLLHKGDSFSPPDRAGLVMTVGNAGALTVVVDGKEMPALGAAGMVKHVGLDPDKLDSSAPPEPPAPANPESSPGQNE